MKQKMGAGELRERVTLQIPLLQTDDTGGNRLDWALLASVWARVEMRGAAERQVGGKPETRQAIRLTIRHRADIAPGMRALWRGRLLHVKSARDTEEKRHFLSVECEEVDA